jgi:O-antigen/teichoic acid export membrane protein
MTGYFIIIPTYGFIGAAWMTVFSELYTGILLYFTLHTWLKRHLRFSAFIKMIVSALVMCMVIYLLQEMHVILRATIGACVYGIMILATRAISKETLQEILKRSNA